MTVARYNVSAPAVRAGQPANSGPSRGRQPARGVQPSARDPDDLAAAHQVRGVRGVGLVVPHEMERRAAAGRARSRPEERAAPPPDHR